MYLNKYGHSDRENLEIYTINETDRTIYKIDTIIETDRYNIVI